MQNPDYHIAIFGHAKHGKSTIAGRLLVEYGAINSQKAQALEERALQMGKDFNKYNIAFLERSSSISIKETGEKGDSSRTSFPERGNIELESGRVISLIDTPGYSRFFSNIVYSSHLADSAIIAIEASAGIEEGTIRIKNIIDSFGIPIVALLISKMDVVGYSKIRYDEIVSKVVELLKPQAGAHIPIIPISALTGEGMREFDNINWYPDLALIPLLEQLPKENTGSDMPIRFTVEGSREIFSPLGVGTVLVGSLESGSINTNDKLIVEPASTVLERDIMVSVRSIKYAKSISNIGNLSDVQIASSRSIISIAINGLSENDAENYFKKGGVLSLKETRPSVAKEIYAEIVFFEPDTVYVGKEYMFYSNASYSDAKITLIENERLIGNEIRKDNNTKLVFEVLQNDVTFVNIEFKNRLCIEFDKGFARLTRFLLKDQNKVVACGRCLKVLN